jgi:hypothetical protein
MDIQLDCHYVMSETIGPATNYRIMSVVYFPTGTIKMGPSSPQAGAVSLRGDTLMKLMHKFARMTPEQRPQDPHMNGADLRFETMEHGGEYPDAMPQAIKLSDAEGRSCIYVPITQDGKVVDSQGFLFDAEDE